MEFDEEQLRVSRGRCVRLTLRAFPHRSIEGRLVCWRDDGLLLDSDTVVFEADADDALPRSGTKGTTYVPFSEIVDAGL
jgi:hypothetical protein